MQLLYHYEAYRKGVKNVSGADLISWKGAGQAALEINRTEKNELQRNRERERREGVEAKTLFTILGGSHSACTEQRDAAD